MSRIVTEQDFRRAEFRNQDPKDYEFREDGKIMRKDRWEKAMYSIADIVGKPFHGETEIADVIARVESLFEATEGFDLGIDHAFLMARRFAPIPDYDGIPF